MRKKASAAAIVASLKRYGAIAIRPDHRATWQRDRFLARAAKHTPAVAVDDHRGNRYFVDPSDPQIGRILFVTRSFELWKIEQLTIALQDRPVTQVVDIGANIGTSVIELLSRYPEASGAAFEPDAKNFGLLVQNITANGLAGRVSVHNVALSDKDGDVEFEISPDNAGDHRVRVGAVTEGIFGEVTRTTTRVPAQRLDSLIEVGKLTVDAGTLAYMDAQGHEGQILAGASRLLAAGGPIAMEFWPYGLRRSGGFERILRLLLSFGRVLNLDDRGSPLDGVGIERLIERLDLDGGHVDLLLIP